MDIVEIGASFDVISPILKIIGDISHGGGHQFAVPDTCGKSGKSITDYLHSRSVETWGHMVVNGSILFTVKKKQAQWAQYLLDQAGIPVEGGDVQAEPNDNGKEQSRQESEHEGLFENIWPW